MAASGEGHPETFAPEDFGIGRLFQHVGDAVIVANALTERIVLWNESAQKLFGYSSQEALELPLHALVPEELRGIHRAGIARYQETGGGKLVDGGNPVELTGLHKAGQEIPIELTLTKVRERTTAGERFALAIVRDISERKQAEVANMRLKEVAADRRRALELNDTIVQGLAVAKLAFETNHFEMGLASVTDTLKRAQALVGRLLGQIEASDGPLEPGDLVVGGEDTTQEDQA